VANLHLLQAVSHKLCRSPVHPGPSRVNLQRVEASHQAQASGSGWPGALLRGGQAKRPKKFGQLSYARVTREGLWVAVVCENYPESQISKEKFSDIQRAIGWLVDQLPEEGFTPRLVDSYWAKGVAIIVCHDELTKDWLAVRVPTLTAWEGSRLKLFPPTRGWWPGFRTLQRTRSGTCCGFAG